MPKGLSKRQMECAELFARGYQAQEIGRHLNIQTSTVQSHLEQAYERLGVRGRPALRKALGIESGGQTLGMPDVAEPVAAVPVDGASAASETIVGRRGLYESYLALGSMRIPPRPPGGRIVLIVAVAVLLVVLLGGILAVLAFVVGLLNSVDAWQ